MTFRRSILRNLFLATAMSAALAACGGDRAAQPGVYKGAGVDDRTVSSRTRAANNAPLAARVEKLEHDVAQIKNDLGQLAMSYNGVMTTNERIDALVAHMEQEQRRAPAPVVEKAAVKPAPVAIAPKPEAKPAAAAGPSVQGVRLGEHENSTRLVIDWTQLGDVRTDLDNSEKLLLVTLSKTEWAAKKNVSGLSSPLVSGWTVDENNGGKILAIQLKKPVTVKNISKLNPDDGKPARVVIDLAGS